MREQKTTEPISIIKIRSIFESLSNSEKSIASYFMSHLDEIVYLTVTDVAKETNTSEATVVRTCKKIGYRGFQDFKITLAQEIVNPVQTIFEEADEEDDCYAIFRKKIGNAINTLQYTAKIIDKDHLEKSAEAILNASRICVFGNGNSASVAIDAAHKLMRTGLDAHAYSDSHMQIMAASALNKDDVVLGISHSGSSKDTLEAMEVAKSNGATAIAITNYGRSPITEIADLVLSTASEETKYHIIALSSRIAQLSIIDTLYIYVSLKNKDQSVKRMQDFEKALQCKKY